VNRDEIYKLLGGYATRTLTDAELHALAVHLRSLRNPESEE